MLHITIRKLQYHILRSKEQEKNVHHQIGHYMFKYIIRFLNYHYVDN